MATAGAVLKRLLVGRGVASYRLEHTLLPKVLALPVFSSDALSSVAYATEEMMLVLAIAGAGALTQTIPIGVAVAVVLAIVVTSYRQTVRAYPRGGGSYIVARENLGTIPGLVAAAAILQDYVLTVAVSITAGTIAIVSAAPSLTEHRLVLALGLIGLIALANLRGVREAGTLFAIPTYGFVIAVFVTLATGFVRCLGGCPQAASSNLPLESFETLGLFVILRAFASGSTALTGVEAIADGVQAFRPPQSKNAATTLAVMGTISITMFLGITALANSLDVRVSEHGGHVKSVLAQIGETVFSGGAMFFVLQVFTALILILAANTAYQDFPRLSAILARDGFMPRQFRNRGDRLVFSNGIVVLSILAGLLVWAFDADLTRLIQLYVVGVFTAFTLSQLGMVRRWIKMKEPGWRRSAVINGIGAGATGIVLAIVAYTKFARGAWIVITATPIVVTALLLVSRHYQAVRAQLHRRSVAYGGTGANRVVLVLTQIDAAAAEALGYIRGIRPAEFRAVYVGERPRQEVEVLWKAFGGAPQIEFLDAKDPVDAVLGYVRGISRDEGDVVSVVIPEQFRARSLFAVIRQPVTFRLKVRLLREPGVVITDVPVLAESGELAGGVDSLAFIPERVVALVLLGDAHDAAVRAVNYAKSLGAAETKAVFVALDNEDVPEIAEEWAEQRIGVPLEIVEAPFRDLGPPILEEIRRYTADPGTVVAVVMAEYVVRRWWQGLLHNQRALFVKRLLIFEPRVILSSVPFALK